MSRPARAELDALSRAVLAMTQHLSVRDVLQMVVESARELLDAEYAALGIPDEEGTFAQFFVAGISDELWERIGPLPRTHGILGAIMKDARPQRLSDIRADPRFGGWPSAHPNMRDFLGVPIVEGSEIKGAIYLANKRPRPGGFTADDEELLGVLAAHAAIALANAHHFERSRELTLVEERNRLARDLHDAVSQKLFSLRLTADAAAAMLRTDPDQAAVHVARVQQLAREASAELRAVLGELRPPELTEDGLAAALVKHVDMLRHTYATDLHADVVATGALPADVEEVAFRVAQEALHNALRHGQATAIKVELAVSDGTLVLEIRDDGRGFDPRRDGAGESGEGGARTLGLSSMRARAGSVRGRVDVSSSLGAGTTVRLEIPIAQRPAGRHV